MYLCCRSFVVIAMEDEEFYEQGEVIALDNALRQCSVRILHSHNTVILGIDTIVDLITLRPKQMCFLSLDNGIAQGEIVSVDTAERQYVEIGASLPSLPCGLQWAQLFRVDPAGQAVFAAGNATFTCLGAGHPQRRIFLGGHRGIALVC